MNFIKPMKPPIAEENHRSKKPSFNHFFQKLSGFLLVSWLTFFAVFRLFISILITPFDLLLNRHKKIPTLPPFLPPYSRFLYEMIWQYRWIKKDPQRLITLENKLINKMIVHSKKYGEGPSIPIPRVQALDLDSKSWSQIYEGFPVIFDGFLKDSQAVKKWSLDYLKERYGDTKVNVRLYGRKHDPGNTGASMVPLSEAISDIRNNGSMYPSASTNLFIEHPELLDELNLTGLENLIRRNLLRTEFFIGGPQNMSAFHCTAGGNLFCQIYGEKKWVFISPRHSMWVYSKSGFVSEGRYFDSSVLSDEANEIEEKYPLYKYVPKYTAHLKPGDVLYNPPWWWHEVSNVNETIGVPIRVITLDDLNHLCNSLIFCTSPALKEVVIPMFKKCFHKTSYRDLFLSDEVSQSFYKGKDKPKKTSLNTT